MTRRFRLFALGVCLGVAGVGASPSARAEEEAAQPAHQHQHGGGEHGEEHELKINWFYGFLGEREGVEPGFLFRPVGMPVPFGAMLVNFSILVFVLYRFGRQPLIDGLKKRRLSILHGIDEATKMKEEAKGQLEQHEQRLLQISQDVERVRAQLKEAAETERARVLGEARERSERMARDARILVEQELKAAREELKHATAVKAVRSAEELIRSTLSQVDRQRISEGYLEMLNQDLAGAGERS